MKLDGIYYKEPVFRPPSEGRSVLIQATEGCTYQCSFCISNMGKVFKIRKEEEIKKDLDVAKKVYGNNARRLFFLDGNAMVMPFKLLHELTLYAMKLFPKLERVSVYAHAQDILKKTEEELKSLSKAGLKMVYIGIETGYDPLLKEIGKRTNKNEIVKAFHKCFKTGITPSGTIILGLAGKNKELSRKHMLNTADLINKANPTNIIKNGPIPNWYISCLALMLPNGTKMHKKLVEKRFETLNADEILEEMKVLIGNTSDDLRNCIFRSNHASNYLAIKGTLSEDKQKILQLIESNLKTRENIRPEYFRGL